MSTRVVKLTFITDFVCANCCVGQHELLNAITYCKDTLNLPIAFELEHMPFRLISTKTLADDSPPLDKEEFLEKHIGKERFATARAAIAKWADEKGIPISFRGIMSQTTRAHRLCLKARQLGGQKLQIPLMCAIFKAHMEEGKHIGDINVLSDIAESCGTMKKEEAIKFLESKELEKEVDEMCSAARSKGITGVPITIIDGKWAVSGGQSSDVYVQIFKKLAGGGGVHNAPSPFSSPVMKTGVYA